WRHSGIKSGGSRQNQSEGSQSVGALDGQVTAVGTGDLAGDRQPQADAAPLMPAATGVELLEDTRQVFGWNDRARIAELQHDAPSWRDRRRPQPAEQAVLLGRRTGPRRRQAEQAAAHGYLAAGGRELDGVV